MSTLKLSQSLEDYLEMIYMLSNAHGGARVKDISAALSVKMPSVAKAIQELKKLGLVTQEPYSDVELSPAGKKAAAQILHRHMLLKSFLIHLGVSEPNANQDACSMEHILSAETLSKIASFEKDIRKKGKSA